jgi:hypothetical protein
MCSGCRAGSYCVWGSVSRIVIERPAVSGLLTCIALVGVPLLYKIREVVVVLLLLAGVRLQWHCGLVTQPVHFQVHDVCLVGVAVHR